MSLLHTLIFPSEASFVFPGRGNYVHRFSHSRCHLTSPSFLGFINFVWENRTKCACSFFLIFPDKVFLPASQKTPIRTSDEKIERVCRHVVRVVQRV